MVMGLTYDDIVQRISEEKGLPQQEIKSRVDEKLKKLSGLISPEGAAHIVANELGINLIEHIAKKGLKINKLTTSMRGISVIGKVLRVYEIRTYTKEGRQGRVGSFLIGDETGALRIVLWDERAIQSVEDGKIQQDVIVKIHNGYIKENNGYKELHVGNQGKIELNPEGITIEAKALGNLQEGTSSIPVKTINMLTAQDGRAHIQGTVVQLFDLRFYDACTQCNKKIMDGACKEHGQNGSRTAPILNFILDDGTENIRVTLFTDRVMNLLGIDQHTVEAIRATPSTFETYKQKILGMQIEVQGRVNMNDMMGRLELTGSSAKSIDAERYATELSKEF